MIFGNRLKYACDTCVKGHRARDCLHFNRISEGTVYLIKDRGRPSKGRSAESIRERFKLVSAEIHPELNEVCPNSNQFRFDCFKRCCPRKQLKTIFIKDKSAVLISELDGVEGKYYNEYTIPDSAVDRNTCFYANNGDNEYTKVAMGKLRMPGQSKKAQKPGIPNLRESSSSKFVSQYPSTSGCNDLTNHEQNEGNGIKMEEQYSGPEHRLAPQVPDCFQSQGISSESGLSTSSVVEQYEPQSLYQPESQIQYSTQHEYQVTYPTQTTNHFNSSAPLASFTYSEPSVGMTNEAFPRLNMDFSGDPMAPSLNLESPTDIIASQQEQMDQNYTLQGIDDYYFMQALGGDSLPSANDNFYFTQNDINNTLTDGLFFENLSPQLHDFQTFDRNPRQNY